MKKELETIMTVTANGMIRLVVLDNKIIKDIFEADDIRKVLNHQLALAREHGFTDKKFRVRE